MMQHLVRPASLCWGSNHELALYFTIVAVSLSSKNFINASWIKTGICNKKFIATQAPMTNTIDDFWQLVFGKDKIHNL